MSIRFGPFRGTSGGKPMVVTEPETSQISELNQALYVLASIFPNISPDVFRETLQSFSGESRLPIAVDQLLRNQDKWVRGRLRTATDTGDTSGEGEKHGRGSISARDEFRRARYKWAVYTSLCQEFTTLKKSAIKAVLAEENHCYNQARATLQKLTAKSWRGTLNAMWSRWKKPTEAAKPHFMITWRKNDAHLPTIPVLRETGDAELDAELYQEVLIPYIMAAKRDQEMKDLEIAVRMNEREAVDAHALYECQCCFMETTFEQMAACDSGSHTLCNRCIRHAVAETLYGQGWGRNIDHKHGLMRCLAPSSHEGCTGHIPHYLVERALLQSKNGLEISNLLQTRLMEQAIAKTQLPLVKCPFCPYAEVDELYIPRSMVRYGLNTRNLRKALILLMITLNFVPLIVLYSILCQFALFRVLPTLTELISTSSARLARAKHLPRRFICRSRACGLSSCLKCTQAWRDPHICYESAALSLRATIESARTAAIKRTCPRCNLAFIKDSGCNKLTCVCGYSMCYVCRQGLGKGEGGEGYRHFCQHFRPMGGMCKECVKCDLYRDLNDDDVIMTAGVRAEKEWRERESMVGVEGIGGFQIDAAYKTWRNREWSMQAFMDWWVAGMITC